MPEPTTVVTLADGRRLAADDVGEPAGLPVVYLHGAPDCRLARHPDDALAAEAGVRLIAVDRPGYGWTDPQPGRPDPLAFGRDVGLLLDHLGVDRGRLLAWSAGAPWSLGIAAVLGDRVERVVTYGALAPFEVFAAADVGGTPGRDRLESNGGGAAGSRERPGSPAAEAAAASGARAGLAAEVLAGADLDELASGFAAMLVPPPPVDLDTAREIVLESYGERARAEVGSVPGALDALALSLAAAVDRHGDAGLRADMLVQFSPGLVGVLAQVACPVLLVHGQHDPIAGPAVGRWLAERLDHAAVEAWPDAGHHALLPRWAELLTLATT